MFSYKKVQLLVWSMIFFFPARSLALSLPFETQETGLSTLAKDDCLFPNQSEDCGTDVASYWREVERMQLDAPIEISWPVHHENDQPLVGITWPVFHEICGRGRNFSVSCTQIVTRLTAYRCGVGLPGFDGGAPQPPAEVPEPMTAALLSMGLVGLGANRRKRLK